MGEPWVLIFAKLPEPGQVKTRLCPPLSPRDAASIHAECVRHVFAKVSASRARPILVGSPDSTAGAFVELLGAQPEFWPQGNGDLGDRLARASARAYASGAAAVVFVGTDSPTMRWGLIEEATERLADTDVVIGPCEDGGYYLIAVAAHHPELFVGIDWDGGDVAAQTRARAQAANLVVHEAPLGYDIDRPADLPRALGDLERERPDSALARAIRSVLAAPGFRGNSPGQPFEPISWK